MKAKQIEPDNVVEKFQRFFALLSDEERGQLWDIITALRGPDEREQYELKDVTQGLRFIVLPKFLRKPWKGGNYYPSMYPEISLHILQKYHGHAAEHLRAALKQLTMLGYIPKEIWE